MRSTVAGESSRKACKVQHILHPRGSVFFASEPPSVTLTLRVRGFWDEPPPLLSGGVWGARPPLLIGGV